MVFDYANQSGPYQLYHVLSDVKRLLSMVAIVPLFEAM